MAREARSRAFDHVDQLSDGNGERTRMTHREFENLPLDRRVRAILTGQLRFFRDGREIPISEALA